MKFLSLKVLIGILLSLLLVGCVSNTATNLKPRSSQLNGCVYKDGSINLKTVGDCKTYGTGVINNDVYFRCSYSDDYSVNIETTIDICNRSGGKPFGTMKNSYEVKSLSQQAFERKSKQAPPVNKVVRSANKSINVSTPKKYADNQPVENARDKDEKVCKVVAKSYTEQARMAFKMAIKNEPAGGFWGGFAQAASVEVKAKRAYRLEFKSCMAKRGWID